MMMIELAIPVSLFHALWRRYTMITVPDVIDAANQFLPLISTPLNLFVAIGSILLVTAGVVSLFRRN